MEFALIFPIFMILVLGTIAVGTAFSRQSNVTQAAREASRYGATYDISGPAVGITNWLTAVDMAVQQSAGAASNPLGGYDYRCVAVVKITNPAVGVPLTVDAAKSHYMATLTGSASTTGTTSCPGTSPALIRGASYVQVVLSRNVNLFVLFANPTLHLDAVSTTPYEGTTL